MCLTVPDQDARPCLAASRSAGRELARERASEPRPPIAEGLSAAPDALLYILHSGIACVSRVHGGGSSESSVPIP